VRVHQQLAYILLNRPYSETSWIVEVFSRDYGRLALMAKGARRIKSKVKGVVLPFQPVLLSWTGKGEIPTLTSAEIDHTDYKLLEHELRGDNLICGFYCNELVINLLHRHDPHRKLFDHYHATIMALNKATQNDSLSNSLREFEQVVMKETGYEVDFEFEADGKTPINENGFYRFQPGQGFVRVYAQSQTQAQPRALIQPRSLNAVSGRVVLSMRDAHAVDSFDTPLENDELSQSKHLMRDILSQTLGYKKIISRELFFPKTRD